MTQDEIRALIADGYTQYYKLVAGFARVMVRSQDGRTIQYSSGDTKALLAYIKSLEALLDGAPKRSAYFRMTQTGNGL